MTQYEKNKELGNALFKQGLFREAAASYDQLIATQPQNPVGYGNKAMALIKLGEYAQAMQVCQRGLQYASTPEHAAIRAKLQYRLELSQAAMVPAQIPVVEVDELPTGYDRS
ncbi:tah1p [Saccharomyces arboricola H-6]|uniref:Tah1p n=1 Tax=Saccharomyces arboricola (strain H-6 / AS 2.3317 / CBS 10644) TaxID=1160507 RepID=J8LQV2_SACAR|nr:tah1p [Saccharomyces arboricola H-6]